MRFINWLNENLEKIVVTVTTAVLLGASFLGVMSRYVMNMSLTWTEEVSLFALIWLAYFGAAISVTRRRHLRIDLIPVFFMSKPKQIMLNILVNVVFFGFALFIMKGTFEMMMLAYNTKQVFAATGIPRWISISAVPCAFFVIALRLVQDTLKLYVEMQAAKLEGAK